MVSALFEKKPTPQYLDLAMLGQTNVALAVEFSLITPERVDEIADLLLQAFGRQFEEPPEITGALVRIDRMGIVTYFPRAFKISNQPGPQTLEYAVVGEEAKVNVESGTVGVLEMPRLYGKILNFVKTGKFAGDSKWHPSMSSPLTIYELNKKENQRDVGHRMRYAIREQLA